MEQEQLKKILQKHKKWLDCNTQIGNKADLSNADLRYANLRYANLSNANLSNADLRYANLRYANLRYANLSNANLSNADLRYANLSNANLSDADLSDAKHNNLTCFFALQCPEEGVYIGYKKARGKIIKLLIPADAKRSSATSRKCRASKAEVLGIFELDKTASETTEISSDRDKEFVYKIGDTVEVRDFDENRWNECSTGIHHFITFDEAVEY